MELNTHREPRSLDLEVAELVGDVLPRALRRVRQRSAFGGLLEFSLDAPGLGRRPLAWLRRGCSLRRHRRLDLDRFRHARGSADSDRFRIGIWRGCVRYETRRAAASQLLAGQLLQNLVPGLRLSELDPKVLHRVRVGRPGSTSAAAAVVVVMTTAALGMGLVALSFVAAPFGASVLASWVRTVVRTAFSTRLLRRGLSGFPLGCDPWNSATWIHLQTRAFTSARTCSVRSRARLCMHDHPDMKYYRLIFGLALIWKHSSSYALRFRPSVPMRIELK